MKRLLQLLSILSILIFFESTGLSQCQECIPDSNCSSPDGLPSVCPDELADATAGEYYSEIATFYMPTSVVVEGIDASLTSVSLASLSGIPLGLEIFPNNVNGTYYPSDGENYGCVTICGTPLVAGEYSIQLTVDVLASAFGFEVPVTESFNLPFAVLEGETSNASFSASTLSGCSPLEVELTNTITEPGTTYLWDIEGNTNNINLSGSNPTVYYNTPGLYEVSVITTVTQLNMTGLNILSLNDGWGGDTEENFIWGIPDPYFILSGNSTEYTSQTIDENLTPNYNNLNIPISFGTNYTVTFFDEDGAVIFGSADDNLGSANFTIFGPGEYTISGNGNTAIITIEEIIVGQFEDNETIVVYESIEAFLDIDADGYGDGNFPVDGCDQSIEYTISFNSLDCNDEDATIYPGAIGTMEGIDNDCNEIIEDDEELAVYGCLEEEACNFNPEANTDNDTCEYTTCIGCTDPLASNYDQYALIPDDSCVYTDCFGDFNNDESITVADLLMLLASFGCNADCETDLTNDDIVSVADLLEILAVYGTLCE